MGYTVRKRLKRDRYGHIGRKKAVCGSGHRHDSKEEACYCDQLALLQKAGEILGYELQKTFKLEVNGQLICRHRVDFLVYTLTGQEVHEYKGAHFLKPGQGDVWKIKRRLFEILFPGICYKTISKQTGGGYGRK